MRRYAPVLLSAALAAGWLLLDPRTGDLAAHAFRADLFEREGFTVWNGAWYGGHHTVAYSVLFPPLAWLLTPELVGALAVVASTALFERLAHAYFGAGARWGSLLFAASSVTLLITGRLPFALGIALGLAALLCLQRERRIASLALAVACTLASPVAGLFLAMAGAAYGAAGLWRNRSRRRDAAMGIRTPAGVSAEVIHGGAGAARRHHTGAAIAACALVPALALSAAFPEGGYQPFATSTFVIVPFAALATVIAAGKRRRTLAVGAVIYAVASLAAWQIETPMGSNAARVAELFGASAVACLVATAPWTPRRKALAAVALVLPLAALSAAPAIRDLDHASGDPSVEASYYHEVARFLAAQKGPPGRVEVPFTASHWETAELAGELPLARGWQRQLDTERNPIFYDGVLNDLTYAGWLADNGVRWVALPAAKPDRSSYRERGLIERDPPYLTLRWRNDHWRVYEVTVPHPLAIAEDGARVELVRLRSDEFHLRASEAGSAIVKVRWTPYWHVAGGCVEEAGHEWTRVTLRRPGTARVKIRFTPDRLLARGRRCG